MFASIAMTPEDALGAAEDIARIQASQRRAQEEEAARLARMSDVDKNIETFRKATLAIQTRDEAIAKLRQDLSAMALKSLDHRLALNAGTTVISQLARELAAHKGTEYEHELARARGLRSRAYDAEVAEAVEKGQISADVDLNPQKYPWYIPKPQA